MAISETYTPTTASHLVAATKNGSIDIHPTDGDELTVEATAKTQHEGDDLDAVAVDIHENGEELSVSAGIPEGTRNVSVDLDIGVPDSLVVAHVVTKNGSVEVRDVDGDARIETKNGQITVEHVDGTVTALTKNGAVSILDTPVRDVASKNGTLAIELPGLPEAVSVETKNGTITIAVPRDLDADFHLDTDRGLATVDGLTALVDASSRTHVAGELGIGGPLLEARTKNGTVTLRARDD